MILLSNSRAENDIYIYYSISENIFIKSTYNVNSIESLIREFNGYKWYESKSKSGFFKRNKLVLNENKTYGRLYIAEVSGQLGNPYLGLTKNFKKIELVIDEYIKLWPTNSNGKVNLHGDFSIGNVIFDFKNIYIIDWEHFHENIVPWGLDLLNLLYESVYFSLNKMNFLLENDKYLFIYLYKKIFDLFPSSNKLDCNINSFITFMFENQILWGNDFHKLPVLKFSDRQIEYLQSIENKCIIL